MLSSRDWINQLQRMDVPQVGHLREAHFARIGVNAHYKVRLTVHHAQHVIEKPFRIAGALEHRATVVALEYAWKQTRACVDIFSLHTDLVRVSLLQSVILIVHK
ncbi:hypothetical protein DPMN_053258 [Dreissena polymorpha]|uniref:Uncharacterized protein n=1 Tax=Dreissena polymorpha TaxID=45954 RepID=A0A9D4CNE5_DREPO|nr:hypothetical protein DPMN_053258 [Dreissena polymorpha]